MNEFLIFYFYSIPNSQRPPDNMRNCYKYSFLFLNKLTHPSATVVFVRNEKTKILCITASPRSMCHVRRGRISSAHIAHTHRFQYSIFSSPNIFLKCGEQRRVGREREREKRTKHIKTGNAAKIMITHGHNAHTHTLYGYLCVANCIVMTPSHDSEREHENYIIFIFIVGLTLCVGIFYCWKIHT